MATLIKRKEWYEKINTYADSMRGEVLSPFEDFVSSESFILLRCSCGNEFLVKLAYLVVKKPSWCPRKKCIRLRYYMSLNNFTFEDMDLMRELEEKYNVDTTKYVLGKLCKREHKFHGYPYSLRRKSNHCLRCEEARTITLTCTTCGNKFDRVWSNAKRSLNQYKNAYCSDECRKYKYGAKDVTCPNCLKVFRVDKYRVENAQREIFCSRVCQHAYTYVATFCDYCGRIIFKRKQTQKLKLEKGMIKSYCNTSCWARDYAKYDTEEERKAAIKRSNRKDYRKHKEGYYRRVEKYKNTPKGKLTHRKAYYRRRYFSTVVDMIESTQGKERREWEKYLEDALEMCMLSTDLDLLIQEKRRSND